MTRQQRAALTRLSLGYLAWVIERMDRFDLPVYDVNPVKDVIDSIHRLHVEKGGNVISFDDVLLSLNAFDHGKNMREESKHSGPPG